MSTGIVVGDFEVILKEHFAGELVIFFVEICRNPDYRDVFEEEVHRYLGFPESEQRTGRWGAQARRATAAT